MDMHLLGSMSQSAVTFYDRPLMANARQNIFVCGRNNYPWQVVVTTTASFIVSTQLHA